MQSLGYQIHIALFHRKLLFEQLFCIKSTNSKNILNWNMEDVSLCYLSRKLAKRTLIMEQSNLNWFNVVGTRITFLKHFVKIILVGEGS